jgi:hypothetical protein
MPARCPSLCDRRQPRLAALPQQETSNRPLPLRVAPPIDGWACGEDVLVPPMPVATAIFETGSNDVAPPHSAQTAAKKVPESTLLRPGQRSLDGARV